MKKALVSIVIFTLAFSIFACGGSGKKGKTLVKVGGETITEGDLELLGTINPRIQAQLATEFGKRKILDNLVEQQLLYQASLKEGLQNEPTIKNKIDIYKKVIIAQAYLDKKLKEAARKQYADNKSNFEKLKMSHVLVRFKTDKNKNVKHSEKEALKIANKAKERIEGGEDFEVVAKEVSEDKMTANRGGDLGYASKDEARLIRRGYGPVLEKAFTMKAGEVAGPIKTEGGYHIIKVTETAKLQPYEDVEQGILFKIRAGARGKELIELRKKYKVEYAEKAKPKMPKVKMAPAPAPAGEKKETVAPTTPKKEEKSPEKTEKKTTEKKEG